jgi:molecular chaperone IbpA
MRTFDLTPLFRSTIGFDRFADMLDSVSEFDGSQNYPPYNIERTDEYHYRISLAVAGFVEKDLTVDVKENVLSVQGKRDSEPNEVQYLYQGIAGRSFERRFQLEENVEVRGARLESGLLHVDLERIVPEEKKPRRIPIVNGGWKAEAKVIDAKQKAA